MNQIGLRELNQQTSRVIDRVRRGEALEITDRGQVVARLVPVAPIPEPLERLVADGRAVPPVVTGPLSMPPVLGDPTLDTARTVSELRDEERW